jgi:uncharacterized membrane protein YebE (DUF533 family)
VILAGLVVIAALAVASYEMWRRRKPQSRERDPLETSDPPPHIYSDDDGDAGDGGDGGD